MWLREGPLQWRRRWLARQRCLTAETVVGGGEAWHSEGGTGMGQLGAYNTPSDTVTPITVIYLIIPINTIANRSHNFKV